MLDVHMVTTHDMQAMKISESQASKLKNEADIKIPHMAAALWKDFLSTLESLDAFFIL